MAEVLTPADLQRLAVVGPGLPAAGVSPTFAVDLRGHVDASVIVELASAVTTWPWVVVGVDDAAPGSAPAHQFVDAVVAPDEAAIDAVVTASEASPVPAVTLATLLRIADPDPRRALIAESLAYSTLQSGTTFRDWLASRRRERAGAPDPEPETGPVVQTILDDGATTVVLDRPARHNAIDARLRLELHDALRVAAMRPHPIVLRGRGPSFCSGGDLVTFGGFADPSMAHLVRLADHPASAMIAVGARVTAELHGACVGGGIELAAFAGRVIARPDTRIWLPELRLGLIPGAGGTVSLPRRIGRHRTMWLALTGAPIDAATALQWGLVDELVEARAAAD